MTITITSIIFCLSLYLFWKSRVNESSSKLALQKANAIKIEKTKQQQRINSQISELLNKQTKVIREIENKKQQLNEVYIKEKNRLQFQLQEYKATVAQSKRQAELSLQQYKTQLKTQEQAAAAPIKAQIQTLMNELTKLKETRAAAHEALLKEQQVKDNKQQYCLIPSQSDLDDIAKLQRVKRELHKPRVLSMLIWQTYWQPLAKKQFPLILKSTEIKTGIYKITNLLTGDCYIGQAIDINKRWKEHCKCGLGIDTPLGNKLYKAMMDYGLQNFAFEILEECPKQQLNEKEKFFIELYQAKDFGYNATGGNK